MKEPIRKMPEMSVAVQCSGEMSKSTLSVKSALFAVITTVIFLMPRTLRILQFGSLVSYTKPANLASVNIMFRGFLL